MFLMHRLEHSRPNLQALQDPLLLRICFLLGHNELQILSCLAVVLLRDQCLRQLPLGLCDLPKHKRKHKRELYAFLHIMQFINHPRFLNHAMQTPLLEPDDLQLRYQVMRELPGWPVLRRQVHWMLELLYFPVLSLSVRFLYLHLDVHIMQDRIHPQQQGPVQPRLH